MRSSDWSSDVFSSDLQLGSVLGTLAPVVLYFSKDGKSLVVGTDPYGEGRDRAPRRLAIIPLDGGKPSRFALPDVDRWQFLDLVRANDDVAWQPDVRYLNVQVREDRKSTRLNSSH